MSNEPTDGGRGGLAFNSTGNYDYTGSYTDDEQRVSSLPTAAEERKLLDEEEYDEENDEGQLISRDNGEPKRTMVAPEVSYKERRHDRVVREGMSYKEAMVAVEMERERADLVREGMMSEEGGEVKKVEEGSVAVVSRWDDDSTKSSAPRR